MMACITLSADTALGQLRPWHAVEALIAQSASNVCCCCCCCFCCLRGVDHFSRALSTHWFSAIAVLPGSKSCGPCCMTSVHTTRQGLLLLQCLLLSPTLRDRYRRRRYHFVPRSVGILVTAAACRSLRKPFRFIVPHQLGDRFFGQEDCVLPMVVGHFHRCRCCGSPASSHFQQLLLFFLRRRLDAAATEVGDAPVGGGRGRGGRACGNRPHDVLRSSLSGRSRHHRMVMMRMARCGPLLLLLAVVAVGR